MENKMKVLVVDDNMMNRKILTKILSTEYVTIEAADGKEALDKLEKNSDIVAVLLDLRMPVMDGYEFLKVVRQDMGNQNLPIIAVTAMDGGKAELEALTLGADDYLIKPVVPGIVRKRLHNAIRLQTALKEARLDLMTGLLNRNAFMSKVEDMLMGLGESEKSAFFVIDLDDFKRANDTMGHVYGDSVLIYFGHQLTLLENENIVCSRLGGDEFAVFLNNYQNVEEIGKLAEECMDRLHKLHISKLEVAPTCSIGISLYPQDGHDVSKLYYTADQALYESKGEGKNCYTFYGSGNTIESKSSEEGVGWILDEMDSYVYICDAITHEIYYANGAGLNLLAAADQDGPKCFCYLLGLSEQSFEFCKSMDLKPKKPSTAIVYSPILGRRMFYRGKLINWDGKLARLAIVSEIDENS